MIGNFFGFLDYPPRFVFSPDETHFLYGMNSSSGGNCSHEETYLVDTSTNTDSVYIKPQVDISDLEPYVVAPGISSEPYVYATSTIWANNVEINFFAKARTCDYRDTRELAKGYWQYNIMTKEYTLIK